MPYYEKNVTKGARNDLNLNWIEFRKIFCWTLLLELSNGCRCNAKAQLPDSIRSVDKVKWMLAHPIERVQIEISTRSASINCATSNVLFSNAPQLHFLFSSGTSPHVPNAAEVTCQVEMCARMKARLGLMDLNSTIERKPEKVIVTNLSVAPESGN